MNTTRRMLLAILFGLAALAACEQDRTFERTGEKMDRAAERAGDAMRDVGDRADR